MSDPVPTMSYVIKCDRCNEAMGIAEAPMGAKRFPMLCIKCWLEIAEDDAWSMDRALDLRKIGFKL